MVIRDRLQMTVQSFDEWVLSPANVEHTWEYIAGEVYEVPSNPFVSMIAGLILTAFNLYLRENPIGYATGEAGGYMVAGERYAPDVAFISFMRQPELAKKGYNPNPPEIAVEVISDPDNREEQRQVRRKLTGYLAAGVLVWVVNIDDQTVEVHQMGKSSNVLGINDVLTCADILPRFELPIKDIFPKSEQSKA